jgi:hypothetical protein
VGVSQGRAQPSDQADRQWRDQLTNDDLPIDDLHQPDFHKAMEMDRARNALAFPGGLRNPQQFCDGRRA